MLPDASYDSMDFTMCDTDLLYDATVGEVVIEGKSECDEYPTMCENETENNVLQLQVLVKSEESYKQDLVDELSSVAFNANRPTTKLCQAFCNSVVSLQGSVGDESTVRNSNDTACIEQRIIVIEPGNDPEQEASLVYSQIVDELNQKAAAAISAGFKPDAETVIEIMTVMKSHDHESVPSGGQGLLSVSGRENIPPYTVSASLEHSAFTLRNREYQTPSPLVSAAERRSVSVLEDIVPEQNCEDFYFRPMLSESEAGLRKISDELKETAVADSNLHKSTSRNRMFQCLTKSSRISGSNSVVTQPRERVPSTGEMVLGDEDENSSKMEHNNGICTTTRSGTRDQLADQLARSGFVHGVVYSKQADVGRKRPPYSYLQLIQMAISSSPQQRMTLREIYQWIEHSFPYYKYLPNQGWKNSIRHNLSLYDIFIRNKASSGKACVSYWMMKQANDSSADNSFKSFSEDVRVIETLSSANSSRIQRDTSNDFIKPIRSSVEYRPRDTVSQKSQRKGLIPLLPKPAIPMQAITLVHMTSASSCNSGIQLITASDQLDNSSIAGNSINRASSMQYSMLNRPSLAKRHSGTSVSDLGASQPYKVKLLCRSISEPVDDVSAQLESSKSLIDESSLAADSTVSLLGTSLDTSSLRQQFSDLQFEAIKHESRKVAPQVKSASDIVLSKVISNLPDFRVNETKYDSVNHSKTEPSRQNRRKQQFNQLLRTPPDKIVNKKVPARVFTTIDDLSKRSESDSRYGCLGESGYSTMHDSGIVSCSDMLTRPMTPPNQVYCRSPVYEMANDDEDVAQMLFTPFKADFSGIAITDLSPVLDLSTSADRDMWAEFTPTSSEKVATRTSTPRRPLNSTPKSWSRCVSASHKSDLSPGFYRLLSEFDDEELSACCKSNGIFLTGHRNSILDTGLHMDISELDFPLN